MGRDCSRRTDEIQPREEDYISNNTTKAVHSLLDTERTCTSPIASRLHWPRVELLDRQKQNHSVEEYRTFQNDMSEKDGVRGRFGESEF